jgi:hypothetical protein
MSFTQPMLSRKSMLAKITNGPFNPRLIPKAYAFVPLEEQPDSFRAFAKHRVPTPALEPLKGTTHAASERALDYICVCSEAGSKHLEALEAAAMGANSLAILTISGEPVATLKRSGYGMPNVLAFRHQILETESGIVHPLIPGGIYLSSAQVIKDAWSNDHRPIVPIDGEALYPVTVFFEQSKPRTALRTYAHAETLFEKLIGE